MDEAQREEFTQIYKRRVGMVYQLCLMLLKNVPDAEDATQSVFRKVLERGEPFHDLEHEKAWCIVTARNECKSQLRHWWRTRRAGEETLETLVWEQPEDGELWELVLKLPERERMAVYLHYYLGYDTAQTARLLGAKPTTLRTWLHRARGKLKQELEAEEYGV